MMINDRSEQCELFHVFYSMYDTVQYCISIIVVYFSPPPNNTYVVLLLIIILLLYHTTNVWYDGSMMTITLLLLLLLLLVLLLMYCCTGSYDMILCDSMVWYTYTRTWKIIILYLHLNLNLNSTLLFFLSTYSIIIIVRISYARLVANRIMNGRGDLHIMIKQIDTFCMMMMCMCG